jgi:DNA-binding transcriptional regulator YiaG
VNYNLASSVTWMNLHEYTKAVRGLREITYQQRVQAREGAGLTRQELAEVLGCPVATLRRWETTATPVRDEAVRYYSTLLVMLPPKVERLPAEEQEKVAGYYKEHFQLNAPGVCQHCGGVHSRACPRVKSLSYHENGKLAHAEYWPHADWPKDDVIFADGPEMQEADQL